MASLVTRLLFAAVLAHAAVALAKPRPPRPLPPPLPPLPTTSQPAAVLGDGPVEEAPAIPAESFEGAVRRSLARHPSVTVAALEVTRAEALLRQARSSFLPLLGGGVAVTRLDADRILGTGATARVIAADNQLAASLTLTVPLVQTSRWYQWSHAKDGAAISRLGAADVRRVVAVSTARAYLSVLAQKRVLEVSVRARTAAQAHHDYASRRRQGGVGNRLDEVRAAQELATSEAQVQNARASLARTREALGVLVGLDGPLDATVEPTLPAPAPAAALDEAEQRRSDVRLARARLDAAVRVERDSWSDYLPLLLATAQPFYQNPPTMTQPQTGWQAQLILTVPFYDGGLRYGQQRERAALAGQARATVEATVRQARSDVRVAFETLRRADLALGASRDAARLTNEALELATLAYRAGATTNIEVIDAERRARDADTAAAVAEDAARQARLDLLASSGRFP